MRSSVLLLLALSMITGDPSVAGEKKEPAPNATPYGFARKNARQRVSTAEEQSRFATDVANLTERIAAAKQSQQDQATTLGTAQRLAVASLQASSGGNLTIHWDDNLVIPIFIKGLQGGATGTILAGAVPDVQAEQAALGFLQTHASLFRIDDPASEFRQVDLASDDLGFTHLRYQQLYQGVEVWGRDVRVHVNSQGKVESFNGRYVPTPAEPPTATITVTAGQAQAIALSRFDGARVAAEARTVYLPDETGQLTLCWLVGVGGKLDQRKDIFVEAGNGRVVKEYNRVAMDGVVTGSGTDVKGVTRSINVYQIGTQYYMIDATKPMFNAAQSQMPNSAKGAIYAFNANNTQENLYHITSTNQNSWSVRPGVSALYTGSKVYDYFKTVHSRNAIDNQGGTMNFVVNFGSNYNNAFWNGQYMVFGNGDGVMLSDLSGGADVAAHELTHGITENTANLLYENQSGALNESFSDVFGALFEFWLEGAAGDWLLGEDVFTPGTAGDAMRSMSNPGGPEVPSGSRQPSTMSEYAALPNTESGDYGGVHKNSGIPNRAFYLFATASGMTKEDAGRVYYRALTAYLTKNAQFVDCRLAVIKSAEDLFGGAGNAKALAAAAAFDAVGITSGAATAPPTVDPPVQGTEYVAVISTSDLKLYRWTPSTGAAIALSSTTLSSRPAVTDNGAYVFYVDASGNLHVVQSDGANDQPLTSSGGFNNIAVSRSGRYLAATSVYSEPYIYVFDMQSSSGDKVLQLYTPTYHQGETAGNINYPDRVDWTSDETKIMYDAYNTVVLTGGDTLGYWDINTVRLADGVVARMFAAQPTGINIGNAVFASNSDNIIALDRMNEQGQVLVLGVNLNTGEAGVITNNYASLGCPSFSVNDKKVYYHYIDQSSSTYQVWSVGLAADGITGLGNDSGKVNNALYPLAFAVGTRATDVPASPETPQGYVLAQNFPNPFNPSTTIQVELPKASVASLIVYDVLGREVIRLMEGEKAAGSYALRFDGKGLASGVYLYRLQVRPLDSAVGGASPAGSRDSESGAGDVQITRCMVLVK